MTGNRVEQHDLRAETGYRRGRMNKVVKDVPAALDRIKSVIAPNIARNAGLKPLARLRAVYGLQISHEGLYGDHHHEAKPE